MADSASSLFGNITFIEFCLWSLLFGSIFDIVLVLILYKSLTSSYLVSSLRQPRNCPQRFYANCSGVSSGGGEIRETKRTNDSQVPQGSGLLSKLLQRSSVE